MMTDGQEDQATNATPTVDWNEAYRHLVGSEPDTLDGDDLEQLASAAFWLGRPQEAIAARRQAYSAHRDGGDDRRAVRTAWLLFHNHFDLDEVGAASGWLKRAQRHVAELPGSVEEGYVAVAEADLARYEHKLDEALSHTRRAVAMGRRHRDRDLAALGIATQGRVLVDAGQVGDGVALLDEAMVAAVGDDLSPFVTGWVYCLLLYTCQELGDVRRAAQWTTMAVRWCEERGQESWYPGLCRLHRCEIQSLHGQWSNAEREALRAAEELVPFGDYLVADAQYLTGELRRRKGDLTGAEDAFRRAHKLGRDPQPGLAMVRLMQGDAPGAATMIRVALAGGAATPLRRARLLAAHVDAELQGGNVEAAQPSVEELVDIAATTGVLLLRGMAARAQGAVLLARDEVDEALSYLREACVINRELSCPYEGAEARVLLGIAARRAGDDETARLEFETAAETFQRLGALPDAERATALLAPRMTHPKGLTDREVEVLALVARGRTNREIAETLFISQHTVARHLSNIFRKLDVTSRSAATAFAFRHDLA